MTELVGGQGRAPRRVDSLVQRALSPVGEKEPCAAVLSRADLQWLSPACELRHLRPGDHLFTEGTTPDAVFVVGTGTVALTRVIHGRHVTLALLHEGSVLGDVPLLTRSPAAVDATAVTPVGVLVLSSEQFLNALREMPAFSSRWAVWAVRRLGRLQTRVLDLLAGDLTAQVASLLLHEMCEANLVTLTQQAIADLLGVQRTSVSRVLHELARRRVISVGYAQIEVVDREALSRIAFGPPARPEAAGA
jgi:CRP-like cAMP-binding protein